MDTHSDAQQRNHVIRHLIDATTASEDRTIGKAKTAVEILGIVAVLRGSAGQRVDWQIFHGPDRDAAGTAVLASFEQTTSITTGTSLTPPFASGSIPIGDWIWVETNNIVGTVLEFYVDLHIDGIA